MADKTVKIRLVLKHDTEENWAKAVNFVPKQGEAIIYDGAAGTPSRIKIGDGTTKINDLPFIDRYYLTDVQVISEDEINAAFETVFGKNTATTLKKLLDARKSTYYLFRNYDGTSVDDLIKYDDTSNVTNMGYMFNNCYNLTTIPQLDTSKVTTMGYMFYGCNDLITIPQLDTSKVTVTDDMFYSCVNLTFIPQLDTSKVTSMISMFYNCKKLTSIPQLDTSKVTRMNKMFSHCSSLTTIPLLNTSNVTVMSEMFRNCSSLMTIPLLDTSNVVYMTRMFYDCTNLTTIPLLDTSNVTDMDYMFCNCSKLTTVPQLDTSKVTDMTLMFLGCSNLTKISMINIGTNLDIHYCTKMEREALLEILGNLKDLTSLTSKKLTLGSTLLAKLTEEDKAIATNKNWTLA